MHEGSAVHARNVVRRRQEAMGKARTTLHLRFLSRTKVDSGSGALLAVTSTHAVFENDVLSEVQTVFAIVSEPSTGLTAYLQAS